ncbi:MAG: efflux RND transporter permease subunit [Hyphomicrobiaceae bacterium]
MSLRLTHSQNGDHYGDLHASTGWIGVFARHSTAANLMMLTLILIGLFSLSRLNRQFFPNFEVPTISVSVPWPGATAEDAERSILDVLEPELRFLDNAEDFRSYAREGNATISIEFSPTADMQKAQADVEQAVAGVTTLPEDAETPKITRAALYDRIGRISLSGPFTEQVLKSYAKKMRDGLLAAGIDRVSIRGLRDEEIWIELREADLRRLGLSIQDISRKVRENTQDRPAGTLEGTSERQLRAKSERKTPEEIGEIEVKSLATGQKIYLRDIANIDTRFEREGAIGLSGGRRAIELVVERSLNADTIETMEIMQSYVERAQRELPKTLVLKVYDVRGKYVQQRLGILVKNGLQGLALVLLTLFIFLNTRVAFWTAAGIPIAMFATLAVMLATGQSVNMVSMFGLIMMLGIIVDDAIVVGEHTAALEERGVPRHVAAEQGATRMFAPVTAATLTTAAAFLPIFFIADRIGDIMRAIPLVVLAALAASLVECFFILPGHLRHGKPRSNGPSRVRRAIDGVFDGFRDGPFRRVVRTAFAWRYASVALMIAGLILAVGALAGGRVKFVFFPRLESENAMASIYFSPGVPRDEQIKVVTAIESALTRAEKSLLAQAQKNATSEGNIDRSEKRLVEATFSLIGRAGRNTGSNLAEINAQLTPSESRSIRTRIVLAAWRKAIPALPGVERVAVFGRRGGPPGRDVDVRLSNGPIETLKSAAEELKLKLTGFPGVSAIEDDLPYGKQELVFTLKPRGTALGFTGASVGQQVRNAFEGAIATRFARGDDEITVRVLREQGEGGLAALRNLYLRTDSGARVPLMDAVNVRERQTFSVVNRRDGARSIAVTADVDTDISSTAEIVDRLEREVMPALAEKYQVEYAYGGRAEERGAAFRDLKTGALLALALIYIILAWVFASYLKPLAVMAIIPFGFLGAMLGHYLLGYNLTLPSLIGLLGLSGILVNDSIVLVSRLTERETRGETLEIAAVEAACDRLRAVLLTSLTTIGGLSPLVFETSLQAQFLIPLAITIVFGLATATVIVLILVPCLVGVGSDLAAIVRAIVALYRPIKGEPKRNAPPQPSVAGRAHPAE